MSDAYCCDCGHDTCTCPTCSTCGATLRTPFDSDNTYCPHCEILYFGAMDTPDAVPALDWVVENADGFAVVCGTGDYTEGLAAARAWNARWGAFVVLRATDRCPLYICG